MDEIIRYSRELFNQAVVSYQKGFFEEALEYLQESLENDRIFYQAWLLAGEIYTYGSGEFSNVVDFDKAIAAYTNAAKYNKPDIGNSPKARQDAVEIYFGLGNAYGLKCIELLSNRNTAAKAMMANALSAFEQAFVYSGRQRLDILFDKIVRCKVMLGNYESALNDIAFLLNQNFIYYGKFKSDADFAPIYDGIEAIVTQMWNEVYRKAATIHIGIINEYERAKSGNLLRFFAYEDWLRIEDCVFLKVEGLSYVDMLRKHKEMIEVSGLLQKAIKQAELRLAEEKKQAELSKLNEVERKRRNRMFSLAMGVIILTVVILAVMEVILAEREAEIYRTNNPYEVGDIGPAGGIIFYNKHNKDGGWQYLEAASSDIGPAEWGAYNINIEDTGTSIGSGKRNTELIVARLKELGETGKAAQLCDAYEQGGYDDWFLPSKDELNLMCKNLVNCRNNWFWSSSQYNSSSAWFQGFDYGNQYGGGKASYSCVRCVRAF